MDDQLLRMVKRVAARRGVTVSEVIQDAVRAQLAEKSVRDTRVFKLITFRGDGPRPGIDLDRTSALVEAEDVDRYGAGRATR